MPSDRLEVLGPRVQEVANRLSELFSGRPGTAGKDRSPD
jgi:hypothetical protein